MNVFHRSRILIGAAAAAMLLGTGLFGASLLDGEGDEGGAPRVQAAGGNGGRGDGASDTQPVDPSGHEPGVPVDPDSTGNEPDNAQSDPEDPPLTEPGDNDSDGDEPSGEDPSGDPGESPEFEWPEGLDICKLFPELDGCDDGPVLDLPEGLGLCELFPELEGCGDGPVIELPWNFNLCDIHPELDECQPAPPPWVPDVDIQANPGDKPEPPFPGPVFDLEVEPTPTPDPFGEIFQSY